MRERGALDAPDDAAPAASPTASRVSEDELRALASRLQESEDTLRAIRLGEVDALVVQGADGPRIFTLVTADQSYRMLVEQMTDAALILTEDGTVIYSNGRLATLLGAPQPTLGGRQLTDFAVPEDRARLRELLDTAATRSAGGEVWLRDEGGMTLPVHLSCNMLRTGTFRGIGVVVSDLREQKRREEAAVDERLTRAILEHAAEPIVVCDAEGRVARANRIALALCGEDAIGRRFDDVYPIGIPFFELVRAAPETLDARIETRYQRADGAEFFLMVSARPIRYESGEETNWVITLADITSRRAAETRLAFLQEITERLGSAPGSEEIGAVAVTRMLLALKADGGALALLDAEGETFHFVRACGEWAADDDPWFGVATRLDRPTPVSEAVRGHAVVEVTSPGDWAVHDADFRRRWERAGVAGIVVIPCETDERVWGAIVLGFVVPRRLSDDERSFADAVARQCAQALERARLYEAERDAREAAERASRVKSDFLATMSHELRTPLNAIQGHVQLLEMELHGPVTAPQRQALARVQRAQRHLLGLINDILNYTKIENGKVEYDVRRVDLEQLVDEVVPMIEPQATARGLRLVVDTPSRRRGTSTAAVPAWADREKLEQVLLNLLSNAVKFTHDGGSVTLALCADCEPGSALLQVQDTGVGVPAERLEDIFAPFVQVRAPGESGAPDGTGLGLAISRNLAHGMGAELTVESEVGRGSTFTVRLRLAPDGGREPGA